MPPELGIGGERRVGGPPGYPGPDAVPSPPRNNLQFPEDLTTMQRSHGVGTPESAREHGRLPRFGKTGQVRMGGLGVGTALTGNRESKGVLKPRCCATLGK